MNIWIFNHYATDYEFPGGTRHYDFAEYFGRNGCQVTIFASSYNHFCLEETNHNFNRENYAIEMRNGIRWIWIKTRKYKYNDWKRLIGMFQYWFKAVHVAKKLENPDVILGSTVHPLAVEAALNVAKHYKVPFVYEVRDLWPRTLNDLSLLNKRGLLSQLFRLFESRAVKNADALVALSPEAASYFNKEYGFKSVLYIPNGVNIQMFDLNSDSVSKHSDFDTHKTIQTIKNLKKEGFFIVMYSGSVAKSNNLNLLLNAAEMLKENRLKIILLVVGSGTYSRTIISEKGSDIPLKILDPVPKKWIPGLLSYADVLIQIQDRVMWGSQNKIYEYMASQKPVISAVYSDHNNLIERVGCGVSVKCMTPMDLVEQIYTLLQMSQKERLQMGKLGRNYIEKNSSTILGAEKMYKLFQCVMEK